MDADSRRSEFLPETEEISKICDGKKSSIP